MKKKAFTLIELLVVIAIIAVLMGILMPALRKVKEQARQRSCGTRVRQLVLSNLMYADDNDGKMPSKSDDNGSWFQDLDRSAVNFMLGTGMTPEMFYCPSNQTHSKEADFDYFWLFHPNPDRKADFNGKRFVETDGYIVAGYGFILSGTPGSITQYPTDSVKPQWISNNRIKMPALRELVVDLIMSQPEDGSGNWNLTFGRCKGGLESNYGIFDTTSHLVNDSKPAGGNVGFMDHHVEWRKFSVPDYPPADSTGKPIPRWKIQNSPSFYW